MPINFRRNFVTVSLSNFCCFSFSWPPASTTNIRSNTVEKQKIQRLLSVPDALKEEENESPTRLFFDIAVVDEAIGRLIFNLGPASKFNLPKLTENLIKLTTQELRSIDPRCSYIKCAFKHSPRFVEGLPQYRWAHVLEGPGRNAVGRMTERITEPERFAIVHSQYAWRCLLRFEVR